MSHQPPAVLWKWENDEGTAFNDFDASVCDMLEQAHRAGVQQIQHPSRPWVFNLAAMTQTNTNTSSKRNVKRMPPSSAPVGHRVAGAAAAAQAQHLPAFAGAPPPVQAPAQNASAPLPSGWTLMHASDNRVYYHNATLNLTQWDVPEAPQQPAGGLPPGWIEEKDPQSGRSYYVHPATQNTTWDRPVEAPANAPAPVVAHPPAQPAAASPSLPPNWRIDFDQQSNRQFYINTATGQSQWDPPSVQSAPDPAPVAAMAAMALAAPTTSASALAGLQTCERSDLTIDTTTEPKEGGNGEGTTPRV